MVLPLVCCTDNTLPDCATPCMQGLVEMHVVALLKTQGPEALEEVTHMAGLRGGIFPEKREEGTGLQNWRRAVGLTKCPLKHNTSGRCIEDTE